MNTPVAMVNRNPQLPIQDWSPSRTLTDPLISSPERSQQTRSSIDPSPPHPTTELDNPCDSPSSPSKRAKKKRRSTSSSPIPSARDHYRTKSGLPKSPSVPTFHTKSDTRDSNPALPAAEPLPTTPTTALLAGPSNSSTVDTRSPSSHKRAPASHSSYGVETSNGPPPSFTTQRTLSQDRLWKPTPPEKPNTPKKMDPAPAAEAPGQSHLNDGPDPDTDLIGRDLHIPGMPGREAKGPTRDESLDPGSAIAGDSTETLRIGGELVIRTSDIPAADEESKNSESDDRKSEDVFLKIAQAEAGGQELRTRSERRKSRMGSFYASSLNKPSNGHRRDAKPADERDYANDERISTRTEVSYQPTKRRSLGPRSSGASAHPLDDLGRHRYFSGGARTHTNYAQSTVGRPDHDHSPELLPDSSHRATNLDLSARSYRRSNLSAFRADRMASTPEAQERPRPVEQNPARVEGTESTLSTTAPSTVWDELDELKSRIRKLELTGKLPSSSAAAMSSAERPRTATTTVTTMSSSPKQGNASTPPAESAIDGISPTVHPLLHEALRNARPVLSADVYQKLESTASDALQLASMMGEGLQSGNASVIGISSSTERQLRRRADSTCRGLTELAIALSARPKSPTLLQPFRPSSRDASSHYHTPPTTSYSVDSGARFSSRFSNDPDETRQALSSRVQSRLEARRASLLHNSIINSPHQDLSLEVDVHTPTSAQSQNPMPSYSSSGLNRAATRLRGRRAADQAEGPEESENEPSPSVRPVSRARTEVGLRYRSARDRTSLGREYTSSHPLPSFVRKGDSPATQTSASIIPSSGLPTRRPYVLAKVNGGSNVHSPTTPSQILQPASRRYVSGGTRRESPAYVSSAEHTPENVTVQRGSASGSRRSLGLTSRLGQMGHFVNGRLRAAKAEREKQEGLQGQQKALVLRVTPHDSGSDQEDTLVS